MNHPKKYGKILSIFLLLCLLCSTLFFSSCSKSSSVGTAGNTEKVVLNEVAHSCFYAPMYVAIENHYFEEEGLSIDLVTGYGADKTMTAVLTGEADIGFMGSEASIYTYLEGANDYVVNFAQLTQRAGNFLVAREPIDNFDWSMLKDSYVLGGRDGGMPEMVFEYILKTHNVQPDTDLTIDKSIDFGSTAAAFSGARINDANYPDFTVEFEPHATALEAKGDGVIVASLGEASGYVPYTAFSAKASYIKEHESTIQAFTNALQKGQEYVLSHSAEETAKVIQPQFEETDLTTITTIVGRYLSQDTWKNNLIFEEDSFTLLENILEEAGQLKERVPYDTLVTKKYAEISAKMK